MLARPGQKLDEEALGGLLAAAGNHEAKALLLSAMSEHIVYSANDLNRLMLECQGQYTTWRPSGQLPFDYCAHSLAPIGLVASEVLNADLTIYGFYKTRYGREFGNALAGHLLSFSERHPKISLIDLFGRANVATRKGRDEGGREEGEPPTRSPLKNYRIFSHLLRADLPIREVDLATAMGEPHSLLGPRLWILAQKHVLTYQATPAGEHYVTFQLAQDRPSGSPPEDPRNPAFSREVYAIFLDHPDATLTRELLYALLLSKHPDRRAIKERSARAIISKTASHLERHGYVKRVRFSRIRQSEIQLTETQREMLSELVALLDRIAVGDPEFLDEGWRLASQIVSTPNRFRALLLKAKLASADTHREPLETMGALLLTLLDKYPDSTTAQLHEHLVEEYERAVSVGRLSQVLRVLRARGQITSPRRSGAARHRVRR